ncbi:hypothetical protein EJ06DRAFT_308154 [Trichodelitschia bisporula]|uniref:Uncharacterized protein n=1 Tax=Trichodelitschia bisporula TaxID=703511 RepID=A0A6G1I3J7_9PEZI|nr:hypothetical protein EJ06DRAFT_308154 [Trichodelitschia bisporula]
MPSECPATHPIDTQLLSPHLALRAQPPTLPHLMLSRRDTQGCAALHAALHRETILGSGQRRSRALGSEPAHAVAHMESFPKSHDLSTHHTGRARSVERLHPQCYGINQPNPRRTALHSRLKPMNRTFQNPARLAGHHPDSGPPRRASPTPEASRSASRVHEAFNPANSALGPSRSQAIPGTSLHRLLTVPFSGPNPHSSNRPASDDMLGFPAPSPFALPRLTQHCLVAHHESDE